MTTTVIDPYYVSLLQVNPLFVTINNSYGELSHIYCIFTGYAEEGLSIDFILASFSTVYCGLFFQYIISMAQKIVFQCTLMAYSRYTGIGQRPVHGTGLTK